MPDGVLIECKEVLRDFKRVVCELDMPTVDMDAALSQVFDAVQDLSKFEDKLCYLASEMTYGEALFENSDLEADAYDRIHEAVVTLGEGLKNHLVNLKAYRDDGTFPFSFRTMLDDNTIHLETAAPF